MPPTLSVQRKCRSYHSMNRKGNHNMVQSSIQYQSLFLWNFKKEEILLVVYPPHWDTSWCGCRISWGWYHCRLWVLPWWLFHIILVRWSQVWESTCHQFFYNVHLPIVDPSCYSVPQWYDSKLFVNPSCMVSISTF